VTDRISERGKGDSTFWHGGPRIAGDMVIPPLVRGVDSRSGEGDGSRVYLATERGLAITYACSCDGWLYEVEPIGSVEQDAHSILAPGVSVTCGSARIIRRFKPSREDVKRISALVELLL